MHTKYMSKKMYSYGVGRQQSRQKEMRMRVNEAPGSKIAISAYQSGKGNSTHGFRLFGCHPLKTRSTEEVWKLSKIVASVKSKSPKHRQRKMFR